MYLSRHSRWERLARWLPAVLAAAAGLLAWACRCSCLVPDGCVSCSSGAQVPQDFSARLMGRSKRSGAVCSRSSPRVLQALRLRASIIQAVCVKSKDKLRSLLRSLAAFQPTREEIGASGIGLLGLGTCGSTVCSNG